MGRKSRFTREWKSATDLGRQFGLSAIAVNKTLASEGLRDAATKEPTARAISEQWVVSTPMRDGTPHFMWSTNKVGNLLQKTSTRLSPVEQAVETFIRDVRRLEKEAEELGTDKIAYFYVDGELPDLQARSPSLGVVQSVCERLRLSEAEREKFEAMICRSR